MKNGINSAAQISEHDHQAEDGLDQPGQGKAIPRILVIDDDKNLLASMARQFRNAGYSVMQARCGREAMVLLDRLRIDLVVTDILMPEGDGLYLIREIRRRWPTLRVIAISGGDITAAGLYLDKSLALGADRAFEKPFPIQGLLATVQSQLEQPHAITRSFP